MRLLGIGEPKAWHDYYNRQDAIIAAIDNTIVYGNAIFIILPYDRFINGAIDDVKRNRNAACPFGVAIDDMFVPVFIVIANFSNCSWSIILFLKV